MFEDFGELEGVFYLLEENSTAQHNDRLGWICDENSEFNSRLNPLMAAIIKKETANHVKPGTSYQSRVLAELWQCLGECSKPSKLRAYLVPLKELLLKTMVIAKGIETDTLQLENVELSDMAEKGQAFTNNQRGLDDLGCVMLDILKSLGKKASAKSVWAQVAILAGSDHSVIQEVDEDTIFWKTQKSGKDKTTSWVRFNTRLSEYRDRI